MDYPDKNYLTDLALRAGKIITDNFGNTGSELKQDHTPVTMVDKSINQMVIDLVSKDFPSVGIIGEEESREIKGAEYIVIFDPMDGTFPFCWNIPISSFCISVIKENVPLVGIIYDPFFRRMWSAEKNKGAFLNGNIIKVSRRNKLTGSSISINCWKDFPHYPCLINAKLTKIGAVCFDVKSIGYFGGLIAEGKIEASIFPGQSVWETAAMQIIVEQAGGKATDIHGDKLVYLPERKIKGHIISNGLIHQELVNLVRSCR